MYFSQVGIPYFNSLTANQLGFQTDFSAHDPADSVYNAMLGLQSWFQSPTGTLPQGPTVTQADIDREKAIYGNTPPPIYDDRYRRQQPATALPGYKTEEICVDANGNIVPKGTAGSQCSQIQSRDSGITAPPQFPNLPKELPNFTVPDLSIEMGNFLKSETAIATGLIILAIVLGIIGITSLR